MTRGRSTIDRRDFVKSGIGAAAAVATARLLPVMPAVAAARQGTIARELTKVGFACRPNRSSDQDIYDMVDEVIAQVLGPEGLAALVKPGDRVVIKVNNVYSIRHDLRGIITDPRITKYVAKKVRDIIGYQGAADLKVVDCTVPFTSNPSSPGAGFDNARLDVALNNTKDPEDICLDFEGNGILDGGSNAELVNLDSIGPWGRYKKTWVMPTVGVIDVYFPKMLRTREEAIEAGEPDEYCDVFIGLPILKGHVIDGLTCAIKLHYGLRYGIPYATDSSRGMHSGTIGNPKAPTGYDNPDCLDDYLVAQHLTRTYDLVITDCLTGQPARWFGADHILVDSMLASRDVVANDTVAALLGGYRPETIEHIGIGRLYGLGTDRPGDIRLEGLTAYMEQRRRVYERYNAQGKYPFKDNYAGARVISNFSPPTQVTVSAPRPAGGNLFSFDYTAREAPPGDRGLARVDLIVDGAVVASTGAGIEPSGTIDVDLSGCGKGPHTYRIAVWDNAFNCALSDERPLKVDLRAAPARAAEKPSGPQGRERVATAHKAQAEKLAAIQAPPALLIKGTVFDYPKGGLILYDNREIKAATTSIQIAVVQSYAPVSFQWRKDGADLPGATQVGYVIPNIKPSDAGVYSCVIRNKHGAIETGPSVLTVAGEAVAPAAVASDPSVERQSLAGIEFVRIPAGAFEMGSPESEARRHPSEGPRHGVTISNGFWMGRCQVTKAQWQAVMGTEPWTEDPYATRDQGSPAECISWEDAQRFVDRMNGRGAGRFRLPTEAEWEYACRAGTSTPYYCGESLAGVAEHAWFMRNTELVVERYAHQVGAKKPNPWGLHDMMGNVWEWCSDWYAADYYGRSPKVDPKGPASGAMRVMRGGAWYDDERLCRSAHRHKDFPRYRILGVGLRLVREA